MDSTTLKIRGMTCGHCSMTVTKALSKISGVESADVNLERGEAVVTGCANAQSLLNAVKEEGYEAEIKS